MKHSWLVDDSLQRARPAGGNQRNGYGDGVGTNGYYDNDYNNPNANGGLLGGGGGLFGNRPSIIGSIIGRVGQGVANAVSGVSRALQTKWNTKVGAAREVASSVANTGATMARAGLQVGMAHPQFAMDVMSNVMS